MRTIEIRRHSFTKKGTGRGSGSALSREGVVAARRLGDASGGFDHVVASTSPRTMETAIAMGFAVDDLLEMPSPVETEEVEFHEWRSWDDPFAVFRSRSGESPAVGAYVHAQARRLLAVADQVGDGGCALVVGHGGWIEAAISGVVAPDAATDLGGSFWHLDGVRLVIESTGKALVESVDRQAR